MPAGSGEAVWNNSPGGSTGSVKLPIEKAPSESVTVTLKETLAAVFTGGVPVRAPAVERFNHEGSLPEVQVYGDWPPLAAKFCEYATPIMADGSGDAVVIDGGLTTMVSVCDAVFAVGLCESVTVIGKV